MFDRLKEVMVRCLLKYNKIRCSGDGDSFPGTSSKMHQWRWIAINGYPIKSGALCHGDPFSNNSVKV
jgi:hypothetical protein